MEAGVALRIIDVRMPMEYVTGHVPGAVNVPLPTVPQDLPEIASSESVVMVCQGGVRSMSACQKVDGKYAELFNLEGGTGAWKAAGLPTDRPPGKPTNVTRQTHFVAGVLVWAAVLLSFNVDTRWTALAALPGFGLLLDAMTGICPMTMLLKRAPWNTRTTT